MGETPVLGVILVSVGLFDLSFFETTLAFLVGGSVWSFPSLFSPFLARPRFFWTGLLETGLSCPSPCVTNEQAY
jgi:hypothetical protein